MITMMSGDIVVVGIGDSGGNRCVMVVISFDN